MEIRYRFAVPPELRKFNRKKVEDAIEKLIMLLDLTDPGQNLEDDTMDEDVDDQPCDDYDQDLEQEEYFACPPSEEYRPGSRHRYPRLHSLP
jgi:hypothetical protein